MSLLEKVKGCFINTEEQYLNELLKVYAAAKEDSIIPHQYQESLNKYIAILCNYALYMYNEATLTFDRELTLDTLSIEELDIDTSDEFKDVYINSLHIERTGRKIVRCAVNFDVNVLSLSTKALEKLLYYKAVELANTKKLYQSEVWLDRIQIDKNSGLLKETNINYNLWRCLNNYVFDVSLGKFMAKDVSVFLSYAEIHRLNLYGFSWDLLKDKLVIIDIVSNVIFDKFDELIKVPNLLFVVNSNLSIRKMNSIMASVQVISKEYKNEIKSMGVLFRHVEDNKGREKCYKFNL